eukprot:611593-Pyramimonas_sp.AAC.1
MTIQKRGREGRKGKRGKAEAGGGKKERNWWRPSERGDGSKGEVTACVFFFGASRRCPLRRRTLGGEANGGGALTECEGGGLHAR